MEERRAAAVSERNLAPLPLEEWKDTKDTLHLYCQIVGKIRLASRPSQNHWWHCPLYVSTRGLTTRRMRHSGVSFEIELDLIEHQLVTRTDRGERVGFPLRDGLSVARFHDELFTRLADLGIHPSIRAEPYRIPMTTPFAEDTSHASYDPEYAGRFWRALGEVA